MTGSYNDPDPVFRPSGTGQPLPSAWVSLQNDIANLWRDRPMVRVHDTAQSIPNNSWDALGFTTEDYDTAGMHSNSANTTRLVVPTGWAGIYSMGACVSFTQSEAGANRGLRISRNGLTSALVEEMQPPYVTPSGITNRLNVSCDYVLQVGDYIEALCYQDTGAAINVETQSTFSPAFWARWEGPVPA